MKGLMITTIKVELNRLSDNVCECELEHPWCEVIINPFILLYCIKREKQ